MRKYVLAAVLVLMASGAQAATLNVIGGQLHGAFDVNVGGSLYDVEFVDGTCIALYGGCDEASDFTFQTCASAQLAAHVLCSRAPKNLIRNSLVVSEGLDSQPPMKQRNQTGI